MVEKGEYIHDPVANQLGRLKGFCGPIGLTLAREMAANVNVTMQEMKTAALKEAKEKKKSANKKSK